MKILVACEESQVVCKAFRDRGHEAYSCDIVPCSGGHPEWHIQDDVRNLLFATGNYKTYPYPKGAPSSGDQEFWDVMIAHTPCTYVCNSGVTWLKEKDGSLNTHRYIQCINAAAFFKLLWDGITCKIPKICMENPIPHRYAELQKYTQIVQPWMFGHPETKATCLWLKNLPKLIPTNDVRKEMLLLPKNKREKLHYLPPSPDRARIRARTFEGLANAMAAQWGDLK